MKNLVVSSLLLGFTLFSRLSALAEDHPVKLPEDGWWIRYTTTTTQELNGQVTESEWKCKLTYSLVGTTTEDGEKYRWVELEDICPLGVKAKGRVSTVVSKFLVAEKNLLESEHALERSKRAWSKVNRAVPYSLDIGQAKVWAGNNPNLMIFPGLWQKSESVQIERIVDFQQGKLTLTRARTRNVSMPDVIYRPRIGGFQANPNSAVEYTAWFDRATAPVFSAAKVRRNIDENDASKGAIEDEIVLEDFGTGAKSKLPDNN